MTTRRISPQSIVYQPVPTNDQTAPPRCKHSRQLERLCTTSGQESLPLTSRSVEAVRSGDMSQALKRKAVGFMSIALGVLGIAAGAACGVVALVALTAPITGTLFCLATMLLTLTAELGLITGFTLFSFGIYKTSLHDQNCEALSLSKSPLAQKAIQ